MSNHADSVFVESTCQTFDASRFRADTARHVRVVVRPALHGLPHATVTGKMPAVVFKDSPQGRLIAHARFVHNSKSMNDSRVNVTRASPVPFCRVFVMTQPTVDTLYFSS